MSQTDLTRLSIEELSPLLAKRSVSPVELVEATLQNSKKLNPTLNAYITLMEEEAISQARLAEEEIAKGEYRGPLHGIPLAVKDNIDTKGIRTTHGSKIHAENIPESNATVVTRLLEAGMIPVGKTNMHEYAYGITNVNPHYGPARNPWNTEKIPGGSSGGSAVAVAGGMATSALGTDTAGSVRIPAACCGIVGLKPTFGRVSKYGVFPLSWTLDHVGPMTKTVKDAALMLQYMAGYDANDPSSVDAPFDGLELERASLKGVTIGIPEKEAYELVDGDVKQGMERTIKYLEELGATVKPVTIKSLSHVPFISLVTYGTEASTIHHQQILDRPNDFGPDVRKFLKFGEVITGTQYLKAQQLRRVISNELNEIYKTVDALILPTIPIPAPNIHQMTVNIGDEEVDVMESLLRLTQIANVTGLPSLAIPSAFSKDNLPVSIQIIGNAFQEEKILNIGYQLEQTKPLEGKVPEIEIAQ